MAALDSSWDILKAAEAQQKERPEHKTPDMAVNEHEEKFRTAMMDNAATQGNTPLKNLIEQSLPIVNEARKRIADLLDNAGVAHAAPNAGKVVKPLAAAQKKLNEGFWELNAHTASSMGDGFETGESSGDALNLTSGGQPLGYSIDALRDAGKNEYEVGSQTAGQPPERAF